MPEEERRQRNEDRAVRRAAGESRRYMVANGLRYMWVLTMPGEGRALHGPEGRQTIMGMAAAFVVSLRTELGEVCPYWFSPELHPNKEGKSTEVCPIPELCECQGHGWHMNLFLPRTVDWRLMWRLWAAHGGGYVSVTDWVRKRRRPGQSVREGIRRGARYGCKYASKDWASSQLGPGRHRYELAQGFKPEVVGRWCRSFEEAFRMLTESGIEPTATWVSDDSEDWDGPRCRWWGW